MLTLSAITRENALSAILNADQSTSSPSSDLPARVVALTEALRGNNQDELATAERALLAEWLARLSAQH